MRLDSQRDQAILRHLVSETEVKVEDAPVLLDLLARIIAADVGEDREEEDEADPQGEEGSSDYGWALCAY